MFILDSTGLLSRLTLARKMRLVKVRKKIFKREFLGFKLVVMVFDICELVREGDETVMDINRAYYVLPMRKGDQIDEKTISHLIH